MFKERYLPDSNKIGILTAAVLLAFALTRLIQTPQFDLQVQLPGFYLSLPVDLSTVMTLFTAGLTATGMDWLLKSHPSLNGKPTIEHWLLPTLTTFVIGVPLSILPPGNAWWIGFAVGSVFLVLVFLAEYIVIEPGAPYYAISTISLTSISYALFLILTVALRYSGARLFIIVPMLFTAALLASLRILHLRLSARWEYAWSLGIALVCAQIMAGLHYWPLTPIQYGLMLIGPLYSLTTLAINLGEDMPPSRAAIGPIIVIALCWGLAILIH